MKFLKQMAGRQKPWRRIRPVSENSRKIRGICYSILLLESAFFVHEFAEQSGLCMEREGQGYLEENSQWEEESSLYGKIYGFDIRLKEGTIEFYRKEEFKTTN